MQLSDVLLKSGEEDFSRLIRGISIGKLKTYQLYDSFKTRARLTKLNTEHLRKAAPRFWSRIREGDEEFAKDLAQAVLVSHLEMITAILDFLGIPHEGGFFAKDMDPKPYLTEGWKERVFERFRGTYDEPLLLFYVNHLSWELEGASGMFVPQAREARPEA